MLVGKFRTVAVVLAVGVLVVSQHHRGERPLLSLRVGRNERIRDAQPCLIAGGLLSFALRRRRNISVLLAHVVPQLV